MGGEHGGPGEEASKWKPKGVGKIEKLAMGAMAVLGISGDMRHSPTPEATSQPTIEQQAQEATKKLMEQGARWNIAAGQNVDANQKRVAGEKKRIDEILREVQQLPDIDTPEAKGNVQK
jgi:hypothetical protein